MIVFRSLLILVIVVMLGVSVSERQLNSLTQRQENVRAFNLDCDYRGVYSIYILGSSFTMSAVYSVGELINNDKAIIIKTANHTITIPTYVEIDCHRELIMLDLWAKLLVDKGIDLKHALELYLTEHRKN